MSAPIQVTARLRPDGTRAVIVSIGSFDAGGTDMFCLTEEGTRDLIAQLTAALKKPLDGTDKQGSNE